MSLSLQQQESLNELRKRVNSKIPAEMDTDYELLRWLEARKYNVDKAEDMLLKSVAWRIEWKIDEILQWTPPEVLVNYYAYGSSGYDKDGSPVLIIPFGNSDLKGIHHGCSKQEFLRYAVYLLEKYWKCMKDKCDELNLPYSKNIFIVDMENFSYKDFTSKAVLSSVLQLTQIFEANYPEILKYAYMVNAPSIFTAAFALLKPFMNEGTLMKIKLFGKKGWQELLLKNLSRDQLPVHYGGTLTDEDGNPKCPSKICLGGKVPKEYYSKNRQNEINDEIDKQIESFVIPESAEKEIEMTLKQEGKEII